MYFQFIKQEKLLISQYLIQTKLCNANYITSNFSIFFGQVKVICQGQRSFILINLGNNFAASCEMSCFSIRHTSWKYPPNYILASYHRCDFADQNALSLATLWHPPKMLLFSAWRMWQYFLILPVFRHWFQSS